MCISSYSFAQFPETFDTEIPATWAVFSGANGEGPVQNWTHNENGYLSSAFEAVATSAEDWLVSPQVTIAANTSLLTFLWTDFYEPEYGSTLSVRVSTTSQTTPADFTTITTFTEADVLTEAIFQEAVIDLSSYIGNSIYIAFVHTQNNGDVMFLDNINLVANASAPDPVTTPTPADNAVDVYIDPTDGDADLSPDNAVAFDWTPATTGDAATEYDVYLGDSPTSLVLLGTTPNDQVNITGMEYSTEYYWQIVATNVGGEAVNSAIWSFTTEADPNLSVEDVEVNNFSHHYNNDTETLSLESANSNFTSVEIYSILGGKALSIQVSNNVETIDVSSLNPGVYLAKVKANGTSKTIKFIKN
ncbi:MAG: choice-of-anchor J domain-containing protein [Winogradskyella arenosi]